MFRPAVGTARPFLKPRYDAPVVEDVLATQHTNHFSFNETFQANRAVLVSFANLHLLYPLQPTLAQTQQLLLQIILLQPKLQGVFQHQRMEILSRHAVDGRLGRGIFFIVVAVNDGLVLVLIVDEVKVIGALGIELDGSIGHISEII